MNVRLKGPKACATMQKRATKVGLDRPSQIVISELESAIVVTQPPARSGQDNELGEVAKNPNRNGHARTNARAFKEPSIARRSRRQLLPGGCEIQSPARARIKGRPVVVEGDFDGGDPQSEHSEADDDGSDIVVTGHRVQSLEPTSVSSDYEDEIDYE